MTTFRELAEAWIASREHCTGSLGRIQFWVDQFGHKSIESITQIADEELCSLVSEIRTHPETLRQSSNVYSFPR